jgi:hypothetical protein
MHGAQFFYFGLALLDVCAIVVLLSLSVRFARRGDTTRARTARNYTWGFAAFAALLFVRASIG